MNELWFYSLSSVLLVSLISLVGIFTLGVAVERLKKILIYMISFSAGALFGDAFIHLLPEIIESETGFTLTSALSVIGGILIFFILEKVIHWQHCHMPITKEHVHPFAYMNLVGDSLHNFIDGLIIAGSYLASIPAGIATTFAVILHEIPQEIGDFGVLIHAGFTKTKAIILNFFTAIVAIIGAIVALTLNNYLPNIQQILVPVAIGGFLYIAGSDLIPELHKETKVRVTLGQIVFFVIGILIMIALLFID